MAEDEQSTGTTPERRATARIPCRQDASLLLVHQNSFIPCTIVDLSLGGCRVRTKSRFLAGPMIRVEVCFRFHGAMFRLPGVTQWTDRNQAAGIRFLEMSARRVDALAYVLTALAQDAKQPAARLPAGSEAESPSAAVPTASACRPPEPIVQMPRPILRSSAPAREDTEPLQPQSGQTARVQAPTDAGTAPPSRTAAKPDSSNAAKAQAGVPARGDRRSSLRYPVDTSATIHLVNLASRIDGQILDLSLGGCRIHTAKPFPVGIFRRVEAEFRLRGLPFRLAGVTQSLHDRKTVGIRFLDMSARKREQLKQLMDEIEEFHADERQRDASAGSEPGEGNRADQDCEG